MDKFVNRAMLIEILRVWVSVLSLIFFLVALDNMCFGPGHVSMPYASMAERLASRTLNRLARVR